MNRFIYILIYMIISGCSARAIDNRDLMGKGFPVHGEFCGPNIPFVADSDPNVHSRILDSIQPIDHIDLICKNHDICYALNKDNLEVCDYRLIESMIDMKEPYEPSCKLLRHSIISYFKMINPSYELKSKNVWRPVELILTPIHFVINGFYFLLSSAYTSLSLMRDVEEKINIESGIPVEEKIGDPRKKRFDKC